MKAQYATEWAKGVAGADSQLLQKVGLVVLQDFILEKLAAFQELRDAEDKPSPLADCADLERLIRVAIRHLPETFFSTSWERKGLDTNDGRTFLKRQMELAVANEGKFLGNLALFKPKPE